MRVRSKHRWLGGTRATGVLGATLLALAAPATGSADTGYLTDGSKLYTLETQSMSVSPVGAVSVSPTSTASHGDGQLYGIVGDSEQTLHSFAVGTGVNTLRGDLKEPDTAGELFVALTSLDSTLYATSYQTSGDLNGRLYTVNPQTGVATPVGSAQTNAALVSLAGSCDGTLYGVANNNLVTVNETTGAHSVVGPLQPSPALGDAVAIAFDHSSGTLWALTYQAGASAEKIFMVNPASGALTATSFMSGQVGSDPFTLAFDSPAECRHERALELTHQKRLKRFRGLLSADNPVCAGGQEIRIFRKRGGPDVKVDSATTKPDGSYRLPAPSKRGTYYALAPKASEVYGVCLKARSKTVQL